MAQPENDDFDKMPAEQFPGSGAGPGAAAGDRWPNPEELEKYLAAGGKLGPHVPLFHADPYQILGKTHPGKVHLMHPDPERAEKTTLCGNVLAYCPGKRFSGPASQITCLLCQKSIATQARRRQEEQEAEIRRQQWEAERQQRDAEFAARGVEWQTAKANYHQSLEWKRRRHKVFARARRLGTTPDGQPLCQGCMERAATEIHHTCYPPDCLPGSQEWLDQEKIYQLEALCHTCHQDMHGVRYKYYG